MIETYLLEYFIAFVEEGSLLKASQRLHVSQPSLTRAMQKLELELDIKLFDRDVNKITLNQNAIELTDYIKDILALNRLLMEKAKELKKNESIIRVSMTAPGPIYLYSNFFIFNKDYKYTRKIADEDTCIKEVKEGLVDIAFINKKINIAGFVSRKIITEKLYVCLPKTHFLKDKKEVTFKELDGQSFILSSDLGLWDKIVLNKLPNSKLIKMEVENLSEVTKYSSIATFKTNITANLYDDDTKVLIPISDDEAKVSFYSFYKEKNKKLYDLIKKG